jgi:hypothetical protein
LAQEIKDTIAVGDVLSLHQAKRVQEGTGQRRILSAMIKVYDTHFLIGNMPRATRSSACAKCQSSMVRSMLSSLAIQAGARSVSQSPAPKTDPSR